MAAAAGAALTPRSCRSLKPLRRIAKAAAPGSSGNIASTGAPCCSSQAMDRPWLGPFQARAAAASTASGGQAVLFVSSWQDSLSASAQIRCIASLRKAASGSKHFKLSLKTELSGCMAYTAGMLPTRSEVSSAFRFRPGPQRLHQGGGSSPAARAFSKGPSRSASVQSLRIILAWPVGLGRMARSASRECTVASGPPCSGYGPLPVLPAALPLPRPFPPGSA
mmetsp:Transcript_37222/g.83193  ORF Transcript_37222/g.83193 Transcript_37222/m.83193 type:complete len:222 (+) Transcript_37222:501-1166(+)